MPFASRKSITLTTAGDYNADEARILDRAQEHVDAKKLDPTALTDYRLFPDMLPMIGFVYALFTLDSAIQHWRGRGGMWKGRAQAKAIFMRMPCESAPILRSAGSCS